MCPILLAIEQLNCVVVNVALNGWSAVQRNPLLLFDQRVRKRETVSHKVQIESLHSYSSFSADHILQIIFLKLPKLDGSKLR